MGARAEQCSLSLVVADLDSKADSTYLRLHLLERLAGAAEDISKEQAY